MSSLKPTKFRKTYSDLEAVTVQSLGLPPVVSSNERLETLCRNFR